jgi:microcystin-dependent protein
MEGMLGEIRALGFGFTPKSWMPCNGQILQISAYNALFAVIGTQFGGDGQTNFALPNLQGKVAIGAGQGIGLSNYTVGQTGGEQEVTLTLDETPAHNHAVNAGVSSTTPIMQEVKVPTNSSLLSNMGSQTGPKSGFGYVQVAPNASLNPASVQLAGGNMPHDNTAPVLSLNYCICVAGVFPPRS